MSNHGPNVSLRPGGLPETVLPAEPAEVLARIESAVAEAPGAQRDAVAAIVADHPQSLAAWAALGDTARDPVEAYAAYRVGYHRGLDRLRQAGWRGSGFVRSAHPENQGFLRALGGLAKIAGEIGEQDEADRCVTFLAQLDPAQVGS